MAMSTIVPRKKDLTSSKGLVSQHSDPKERTILGSLMIALGGLISQQFEYRSKSLQLTHHHLSVSHSHCLSLIASPGYIT